MHKIKTGEKMGLLGMDTCPSLNDIMEIRCNKCTRSEQGYDFLTCGVACLVDYKYLYRVETCKWLLTRDCMNIDTNKLK
jgi:hypothetical protein